MLHFQLRVFAWDESPKGQPLLSATEDIVFFPLQLVLAPGEERKARLGRTVPVDSSEKTYRLFVDQLPPPEKARGSQHESGFQHESEVRMMARVTIPIFIQPNKQVTEGRVEEMAMRKGLFSFQIKNTGNIHFLPQDIRISGFGVAGEAIFERKLNGWYVLAGGLRVYELDLSKEDCFRIKALAVELKAANLTVKDRFHIPPGACGQ